MAVSLWCFASCGHASTVAYSDYGKNTCSVDGWLSPNGPSDLRCRIHIGANSLSTYSCNVIIKYEPAPAPPPSAGGVRQLLSVQGNPVVRFTGSVHDWSGAATALPVDDGAHCPGNGIAASFSPRTSARAFSSCPCAASARACACAFHPVFQAGPSAPVASAPDVITVTKARIGCLDIQADGNLTGLVAPACNGKSS